MVTSILSYQKSCHHNRKMNGELSELNDIVDEKDLTDIDRPLHPKIPEYTFSKQLMKYPLKQIIIGYKTHLNKGN